MCPEYDTVRPGFCARARVASSDKCRLVVVEIRGIITNLEVANLQRMSLVNEGFRLELYGRTYQHSPSGSVDDLVLRCTELRRHAPGGDGIRGIKACFLV